MINDNFNKQIISINNNSHSKIFKEFIDNQNKISNHLRDNELSIESKINYSQSFNEIGRFISIAYDEGIMTTSDDVIFNHGGLPKSSFLIATLNEFEKGNFKIPYHFILLKIIDTSPLPLSNELSKTFLDWHKKATPKLDNFTASDLKWSAIKCQVKGQFYISQNSKNFEYASDINLQLSPLHYVIYKPNDELLNIILNSQFISNINNMPIELGYYRATENLMFSNSTNDNIKILIDGKDLLASRTAMFGKTRLGKSNTVKLLIRRLTEHVLKNKSIRLGQLIFDINGEYAYSNEQDKLGDKSGCIKDIFPDNCIVYSLNDKNEDNKKLKINFYGDMSAGLSIFSELAKKDNSSLSNYMQGFLEVSLPADLDELASTKSQHSLYTHKLRKILIYWGILRKLGFEVDNKSLDRLKKINGSLNMNINSDVLSFLSIKSVENLDELVEQLEEIVNHDKYEDFVSSSNKIKVSKEDKEKKVNEDNKFKHIFDNDEKLLIEVLKKGRNAINLLKQYNKYHSSSATNFEIDIINYLSEGKIVILDLSSAVEGVRKFFADKLSMKIFKFQENLFIENELNNKYIQIYFEEAHNIFPQENKVTDIYSRFAKEGAKFNIGIVYSTQSPSTINKELLNQTENFFIGHISSPSEVNSLSKLNIEFVGIENEILKIKQKGYMRVLTNSHRFVVPIQIKLFNE